MDTISPAGSVDLAVTVDDLLIWEGTPIPSGYSQEKIVRSILDTFEKHNLRGIYGFPHTSRLADDPGLHAILEDWVESGHHIANHTHCHACLNWLSAKGYCDDIRRAEDYIGDLIARAPRRYFRYAMDMSGESEAKRGEVEDFLRENGYVNAPITAWFGDFAWIAPYYRAVESRDADALKMLQQSFVKAAVDQLRGHSAAARAMFGRDIPYIWLIHATAIVADTLDTILTTFARMGVRHVSLEAAMRDPIHNAMPRVSPKFRNHLQRYALAQGVEFHETPPATFEAVLNAAPIQGWESIPVYENVMKTLCRRAGGTYSWDWS